MNRSPKVCDTTRLTVNTTTTTTPVNPTKSQTNIGNEVVVVNTTSIDFDSIDER